MKLLAKTHYGLEQVLAEELKGLGASGIAVLNRAVAFEGSKLLLYTVNYCSRLALSVLMPVSSFAISGQKDLYNGAVAIEWDRYLDPGKTIAVTAVVNSPHFSHSGYAALLVKDAIADFFRRLTLRRPSVDAKDPDLLVNVHISNNRVTISIDSTVVPLYRRGYRRRMSEAPLSEVLAAGLIALSGWKPGTPLTDGMCGSGTIVTEAGLISCNIAPGRMRKNFGFMRWKDYDAALFRSVRFDAEKRERKSPAAIFGSDISAEACAIARANVRAAGLEDTVEISGRDFFESPPPAENGMLIINPPYGRRLGTPDMDEFYGRIGSVLKHRYEGYTAWILSGDMDSLRKVALKPFRKFDLLNGDIECRFQGYELYGGTRKHKNVSGA
ncbi:MAG TPA: THUMP domain-containing protein [Bacteroidales bacterium]|jgi:putative N6-adenine-specific DNA methylase|nr:THUMP domain-containing protein [Bacteroidales bacterium]